MSCSLDARRGPLNDVNSRLAEPSAFTSVQKQEGELKLLNLTKNVHDVMQITKLYTVFDIMEDEEVAVRSFAQPHAATA